MFKFLSFDNLVVAENGFELQILHSKGSVATNRTMLYQGFDGNQ